MPIFQDLRQSLGNFADTLGTQVGLPELGLSERIAGGPTVNSASNRAFAQGPQSTEPNFTPAPNQSTQQGIFDQFGNQIGSSNTFQRVNVPTSSGGGGNSGGGSRSSGGGAPRIEGRQNVDFFVNEFGERQAITNNPESRYFDQQAVLNQVNDIFSEVSNFLGRSEGRVREGLDPALEGVESQFETSSQELGTGRDQTLRSLDENRISAEQRRLDAANANARLLDELRRGSLQRFGGASSAGQAATELANVEAQRRAGQTQQDFNTAVREIQTQQVQVEEDYQNRLSQLRTQKQLAENQIRSEFRDRIQQIDNLRAEAAQNKGAMKLQALQNLRNQVFQLNLQETQFQQQLQLMREQANIQLQSQQAQLARSAQSGAGAFNTFANQASVTPSSQFGVSSPVGGGAQQQFTGSIRDDDDLTGFRGFIPGSSDRDPRFQNFQPRR